MLVARKQYIDSSCTKLAKLMAFERKRIAFQQIQDTFNSKYKKQMYQISKNLVTEFKSYSHQKNSRLNCRSNSKHAQSNLAQMASFLVYFQAALKKNNVFVDIAILLAII